MNVISPAKTAMRPATGEWWSAQHRANVQLWIYICAAGQSWPMETRKPCRMVDVFFVPQLRW